MIKFCSVCFVVILLASVSVSAYSQTGADEHAMQWQIIKKAEIAEIYDTTPVTLSIKTKNFMGMVKENMLTIHSGCEFYLNDELSSSGPATLNPGDRVKIEYEVIDGEKVAFNIYVTR